MSGVKGRSGRQRAIGSINAENALNVALRSYIAALEDPKISPLEKAKLALPIVAKRFPDKVEQTIATIHLSPQIAGQYLEIFKRNVLIYEQLAQQEQALLEEKAQELTAPSHEPTGNKESLPLKEDLAIDQPALLDSLALPAGLDLAAGRAIKAADSPAPLASPPPSSPAIASPPSIASPASPAAEPRLEPGSGG